MSRLLIVGASSGIGRDIQPSLMIDYGHTCIPLRRGVDATIPECDAMLLCQRFRGTGDEWLGEIDATLSRTKALCEWAGANWKQGGSIVMMASVAAVSVEEEQPVGYHVCKAGLLAMMRYYATTLGPQGIRVNAIIPGLTIKPEARAFYGENPKLEYTYTAITPLQRMCSVEALAFEVDRLIDDRSYITGQTIVVDGGISLRSHWALARKVHPNLQHVQVTQRSQYGQQSGEVDHANV